MRHGSPIRALGLLVPTALLALVGCTDGGAPEGPPSPDDAPDYSSAALWLPFDEAVAADDGSEEFPAGDDAPYSGVVVQANGGGVEQVEGADGRGRALQFPGVCADDTGCPMALVEVAPDPALAPGSEPFSWGASVRLSPSETTDGSNVVQQGRFASEGGQWKLQVDGDEGLPSCRVRGDAGALVVTSTVSVADDVWHRVVCHRDDEGVSVAVDGEVTRESGPSGALASSEPIRVGSPGVNDGDDQFSGAIDDVFLELGSSARVE
ncbi:hypothetical protein GCM10009623_27710 [Nocardioides aestuarii]|uniref:LamG-like jellyroll fold domain-containing protein n=1 Tax=Nocardioides aestuarii TaxID=252231 RepID=A0ABW4TQ83_9ACTN